jgi:hypothetical protein
VASGWSMDARSRWKSGSKESRVVFFALTELWLLH